MIAASNGLTCQAVTLFCYALRFLKDQALAQLVSHHSVTAGDADIRWVVTLPSVCSGAAKQLLRLAAYKVL